MCDPEAPECPRMARKSKNSDLEDTINGVIRRSLVISREKLLSIFEAEVAISMEREVS